MCGVTVSFDFTSFSAAYPEFVYLGSAQINEYWNMATVLHANDGTGPVPTATIQTTLLNALTAHIAYMFSGLEGQGASPLVGQVTTATQGSVNVGVQALYPPGSAAWYTQTKYGALYYAMCAAFRVALYVPGPSRIQNPYGARLVPFYPPPGPN
jgi:hypothetical protein